MRCALATPNPIELPGIPTSCDLIDAMPDEPIRLAMSRGKDSLVAWLHFQAHGRTVEPVFMWNVPHLRWIDEDIARLEVFFGQPIPQISHPSFWRQLYYEVFQPPERIQWIRTWIQPPPSYDGLWALYDESLDRRPGSTPVATGVRASDSIVRRLSCQRHGVGGHKPKVVWDWRVAHLREVMADAKLALPLDYEWFGRSFDGIDSRFIRPLRDHNPEDYQRVLEWFPLAWLGLEPRDEARKASA